MAFYYVKSGGTATGDAGRYATQQTGSFAGLGVANYYNSLLDAIAATTPLAELDVICCSNLHDFDNFNSIIQCTYPTGAGVRVISVNDVDIESYLKGAKEQTNSGIRSWGNVKYYGITHDTGSVVEVGRNSSVIYVDSDIVLTTTSDSISATLDGAKIELIDTEVSCATNSNGIRVSSGGFVSFRNVLLSGVNINNLILDSFGNGGGSVRIEGSDLSICTGTLNGDGGSQNFDDLVDVKIDMCTIANGVARSVALSNYNQNVLVTRCSDASAGHDYNFGYTGFSGNIDQSTTTYRNEDEAFAESSTQISYEIASNTNCSKTTPLVFKFPILQYSKLSEASSDVLTFFLTCINTLTNDDIFIEAQYPDGTNKQVPNKVTSQNLNYFMPGTTLTTDGTSTWTGALTNNYLVALDTSSDPGADCQPIVTVTVTRPSTTINIASEYELS